MKGTIVQVCSLCGYEYARWFDAAELDEHMAKGHGMYFVPGSLRPGDPPRWIRKKRDSDE